MSSRKTFDQYQEEYRKAIAQRDREDEELLLKLTDEASNYKADFNNKIKQTHKKTYENSKRKQIELYENLSSTSDLKTWERILNMCDVEHPPESQDLSTMVNVMKKMDARVIEKPAPVEIKRGEIQFDENAPSPISGTVSSSKPKNKAEIKKGPEEDDLFNFMDEERKPSPKISEEKVESPHNSEPIGVSPGSANQGRAPAALEDLFGFNGEEAENKVAEPIEQSPEGEQQAEEEAEALGVNDPANVEGGDEIEGKAEDFDNMFDE